MNKALVVEIKIDYEKCEGCKKCIEACSFGVLEWFEDMPIVVNASECSGCRECQKNCPVNAIIIKEK